MNQSNSTEMKESQQVVSSVSKSASCISVAENDVLAGINLTVSEGKRLIAKGISALPVIREKMQKGTIIITRGTTNTYIAEELMGLEAAHGAFLTGHFVPEGTEKLNKRVATKLNEIILVDGKQVDMTYAEALKTLKAGDIVLKGGNLLNYDEGQAAVCVGAADGGTIYKCLPFVGKGKAQLIVPIGLEKETSANLKTIEKKLEKKNERLTFLPKIYVYKDYTLYTEVEALKQFANVKVFPFGIGGVAGREGGISLVVAGSQEEVNKVLELVKSIQGEKPFDK